MESRRDCRRCRALTRSSHRDVAVIPQLALGAHADAAPEGRAYSQVMNGYDMNGWGWGGMTLMAVVTVAIVGLVVWVIARRSADPQAHALSAHEQLDQRLASGAIDPQEYRERLDSLRRA